jgi:tripartite-type tricarboxylate transporter receptor subunit TctC
MARIIVPFSPGAGTDITARMLARKLHESLGQPFIVENRPGAAGMLGAELVARAPADGYTLLFGTAALSVNATLRKSSAFDLFRDLAPITLVSISPQFLIVHPSMPARSVKELVALARKNPGKLNVGSTGNGSSSHLAIEMFSYMAGVKVVHVPYKGGAPAGTALLSGELDFYFQGAIAALANMRSGRVRALAVTSRSRSTAAPEVPTLHSYYPGYESVNWFSLFAPTGTPPAIISKVSAEVRKALKTPEVLEMLSREGVESVGSTPAELGEYLRSEVERYAKIIKIAKLQPE